MEGDIKAEYVCKEYAEFTDNDDRSKSEQESELFDSFIAGYFLTFPESRGAYDRVSFMTDVTELPDYPETHESGFAYCVDVTDMEPRDVNDIHKHIQYGHGNSHKQSKKSTPCPYLAVKCTIRRWRCSGVKLCSQTADIITNVRHTKLDKPMRMLLEGDTSEIEKARMRTRSYADSVISAQAKQCSKINCRVRKISVQPFNPGESTSTGETRWRMECWASANGGGHWCQTVPDNQDPRRLRDLLDGGVELKSEATDHCDYLQPLSARRKICGLHGRKEEGFIYTKHCDVVFVMPVPQDLTACPHILFASFGEHTHPPPPPSK